MYAEPRSLDAFCRTLRMEGGGGGIIVMCSLPLALDAFSRTLRMEGGGGIIVMCSLPLALDAFSRTLRMEGGGGGNYNDVQLTSCIRCLK